MSWFSRTILQATLAFLPVLIYLGTRITFALNRRFGTRKVVTAAVLIVLALVVLGYPVAIWLGHEMGWRAFVHGLHRGNSATDPWLVIPFWLGLAFSLQALPWFLITDLTAFAAKGVNRLRKGDWPVALWADRIILGLSAFLILYVPVRAYLDTTTVSVDHRRVELKGLHKDLKGFRIVHVSDIQADPRTREDRLRRYMEQVNELRPDIVVFTGDLITSGRRHIKLGARMLGLAKTRRGTFAVLGDHDYWSGPNLVARSLRARGVRVVRDGNAYLTVGRARVGLSLLTSTYPRSPSRTTLRRLARGVAGRDLRVMVGHQPIPYLAEFADNNNYQLFLAGHTHGGQVGFYLPGLFLSASNVETPFVSGMYPLKKTLVYVNNGLGMTLAPLRFQAPATVTLLELLPGQ